MAQLKDLIVNGASRFIGDIFGNNATLNGDLMPETDNTQSLGDSTHRWKLYGTITGNADTATAVTQAASANTNAAYRILLSTSAADTEEQGSLNKDTDLRWNPSTNTLNVAASNSNGIITTTKGTMSLVSASTLYLNSGASASMIITRGGADTNHEVARFNTSGHFLPGPDENHDIGSSSTHWGNVYADTYASGAWHGSTIDIAYGGTGATTAAAARTNLLAATGNARIFYGTCSVGAATTTKVVTCAEYDVLTVGDIIFVKFSEKNTGAVASLKLKVNSTEAKPIQYLGNAQKSNLPGAGYILADTPYRFVYDGTNWVMDLYYNTNTNTLLRTYALSTNVEVPIVTVSKATNASAPTHTSNYADLYGMLPATVANRATINLSTGYMRVPTGITTGVFTANEVHGKILYLTSGDSNYVGYGTGDPGTAVNSPAPGQMYFKLID